MLENPDWSDFQKWSPTITVMYSNNLSLVSGMRETISGTRWEKHLEKFPAKNATVVRQAYALSLYEKTTGRLLSDGDTFLEFGGGYGELARLVFMELEPGEFTIYDFPELSILQEWYLDKYVGSSKIKCVSEVQRVRGLTPTVFVSMTGLSEAPEYTRRHFLGCFRAESILLQYQKKWWGCNNEELFSTFAYGTYCDIKKTKTPNRVAHTFLIAHNPK
jgi:hypothetical protein